MDDETQRAAAIVASVVLVIATLCVSSLSWTLTLAAGNCEPHASALICTEQGQLLATRLPAYGSIVSTAVALLGAWAWPRRRSLLLVGYGGLLAATCAGVVIASTAS